MFLVPELAGLLVVVAIVCCLAVVIFIQISI
jgi:hypothetical protein